MLNQKIGHENSANIFSKLSDMNNMTPNIFELDKRAKTATIEVGKIYNNIQKFNYKENYSDIQAQKYFSRVKEHLILKSIRNDNEKRKFLLTKKLFDVFVPIYEEDYRLEDVVKHCGIKTNPEIFKRRKTMLVIDELRYNKSKSKHKEALAQILKNINDLKESFLHKPKPVKINSKKDSMDMKNKGNIKNNKKKGIFNPHNKNQFQFDNDVLKKLKNLSKNEFSHLADPGEKREIDKKTLSRLSSPKRIMTKVSIKDNNGTSTPNINSSNVVVTPKDKINLLFNKMIGGAYTNSSNTVSPSILKRNSSLKKISNIYFFQIIYKYKFQFISFFNKLINLLASAKVPKENLKIKFEMLGFRNENEKEIPIHNSIEIINQNESTDKKENQFSDENKNINDININKNLNLMDYQNTIISENSRSYISRSNKKKNISIESFKKFKKKESFITESRLTGDYFTGKMDSAKDSLKINENNNLNNLKINKHIKLSLDVEKKENTNTENTKVNTNHKNSHLKEKRKFLKDLNISLK